MNSHQEFFKEYSSVIKVDLNSNCNYRLEAINNGKIIDISFNYPSLTHNLYRHVAFNKSVWDVICAGSVDLSNLKEMMVKTIISKMIKASKNTNNAIVIFSVMLLNENDQCQIFSLEAIFDTGHYGEPVVTVGFKDEGYVY